MGSVLSGVRSTLYLAWLVVSVIPWASAVVVASIFKRGAPIYWACAGWLKLSIHSCRWICGVRWRVHGGENLGGDMPLIVLPKHQSAWETFAFPMLCPKPLCYVFKRELLYIPFFGWSMARIDMIHIDRSKKSQAWNKVAEQGKTQLARGNWIIMFPEGTRSPRGGKGTYKMGGTRLAVTTGASVVPVAVTSARCWPRKSFFIRPGVVDVSFGKPISSVGRTPEDLMHEVETWIEAEMRRLDPEAYPALAA